MICPKCDDDILIESYAKILKKIRFFCRSCNTIFFKDNITTNIVIENVTKHSYLLKDMHQELNQRY